MEEIWKTIEEFPNYEVSSLGNVRNKKTGRILKSSLAKGYPQVILCQNGDKYSRRVHRLVATAFLPNPNNYPDINHKDECKTHNNVDNLEWCDETYNIQYSGYKLRTPHSRRGDLVKQYDHKGNLLNEYKSTRDAWRETGIDYSAISKCCRGLKKQAGGFIWKYE